MCTAKPGALIILWPWCLILLLSLSRHNAYAFSQSAIPGSFLSQRQHKGIVSSLRQHHQTFEKPAENVGRHSLCTVCKGQNLPADANVEMCKKNGDECNPIFHRRRLTLITLLSIGVSGAGISAEASSSGNTAIYQAAESARLQAQEACKESWALDWRSTGRGSLCLEPGGYLWRKIDESIRKPAGPKGFMQAEAMYSKPFIVYLGRFLLNFDSRFRGWWLQRQLALPSGNAENDHALLQKDFSHFIASVEYGLSAYKGPDGPMRLGEQLFQAYAGVDNLAREQLAILFSLQQFSQPQSIIERCALHGAIMIRPAGWTEQPHTGDVWQQAVRTIRDTTFSRRRGVLPSLLPHNMPLHKCKGGTYMPAATVGEYDLGFRGAAPVKRERQVTPAVYTLFALSGMVGCAGMHTIVVPLDVVKTREQVSPGRYGTSLVDGIKIIWREEGINGVTSGIVPTVLGYSWYGMTVYPGYEFLKRLFAAIAGEAADSMYHVYIVLLAGACSTAVACIGVCPAGSSFASVWAHSVHRHT
jgi:hypothetical protein